MVAVINTGNSISRTLNYNEQKVQEGKAKCIGAVNYPKGADQLKFYEKLNMLKRQAELNENVKRNSAHISLNFDPSDRLDTEKMLSIAHTYMKEIGFENQPYLIYQHFDAGHPHLHLVSIKVRNDGSRINMQNIGRNRSRKACESLEKAYKLVVAKDRKEATTKSPNSIAVARYGKSETRRAISNVLEQILPHYLYTSLPELNAVLKQYNVAADRCSSNSRTFKHKGLFYRLLDNKGNPVGIPIKASLFYNNPGLKFLTERFNENELKRLPYKTRIKNAVNIAFTKNKNIELKSFVDILQKDGIHVILRQNEKRVNYGITYIDHQTRAVFNGSDLGKGYSIKAIIDRCKGTTDFSSYDKLRLSFPNNERNFAGPSKEPSVSYSLCRYHPDKIEHFFEKLAKDALRHEANFDYVSPGFKKKTKKRKRKQSNNL